MKRSALLVLSMLAVAILGLAPASAASPPVPADAKGKTCRMEQQCHWENFKKICVYVKVCR
jgi:Spy/CpxP family protein refolding chaperone